MKRGALIALVAGTSLGGLSLVLLMNGWLGLVPYPLIAGGAVLLIGGIVGAAARKR